MYFFFSRLSRIMAYLGGVVLSVLIILICLSILGRELNGVLNWINTGWAHWLIDAGIGPIDGDFELVEAGMAFAIFSFLPLCQISGSHAAVDIFTSSMSRKTNRILRWVSELAFAAVMILISVQITLGMLSKMRTAQTTLLLEFPVWWGYAFSVFAAAIAALVAVYIAAARTAEIVSGRALVPADEGAEH